MPGLMINKSTEVLIEGNYNHGNDIKELGSINHLHHQHNQEPPTTVAVISPSSLVSQKNGGLISSCSSISNSVSAADAVNFTNSSASTSSSGLSSTTNIAKGGGGGGVGANEGINSPWNKMQQRFTWHYALDLFMVLGFGVLFALIETNVIPVYKRGFFCGDRTIAFKFTGDTVSIYTLLIVTLLVPVFVFWIFELVANEDVTGKTPLWKATLFRALRVYRDYIMGQIICLAVVSVMKNSYGGLRPHFLDTCRPDVLNTCVPGEFVTDYTCTNLEVSRFSAMDSRKSFPSGHSSMSVFQAIFTVYYLQMRFCRLRNNTAILILQFTFLAWGIICSISRMTDYRHHWWDVLFGASLGIIFAILTCSIFSRNFNYLDSSKSPVHIHINGHSPVHPTLLSRGEHHSSRSDV